MATVKEGLPSLSMFPSLSSSVKFIVHAIGFAPVKLMFPSPAFGDVTGIGNTGNNPINGLNAAILGAGILTGGITGLGGLNSSGFSIAGATNGSSVNLNLTGNVYDGFTAGEIATCLFKVKVTDSVGQIATAYYTAVSISPV
jgi:hypothetical protein